MLICGLNKTTLLDYPGKVAATVFTGGCNFRCPFCHNKDLILHPAEYASHTDEDVFSHLKKRAGILQGVCITGGEPLLLGGGAGVPPLYLLARELIGQGKRVTAVLGFNTAEEVFFEHEFRQLGCSVTVTTVDGSLGTKGFVTDGMPDDYSYFYTCGPEPMLKAVYRATGTSGQFSFEERMGCGFGACMGCSCRTVTGYKRICKDGPVLEKEEILWED